MYSSYALTEYDGPPGSDGFDDPNREPLDSREGGGGIGEQARPARKIALRRRDWKVTFWEDANPGPLLELHRVEIRYAVWQREVCPSTRRLHWQCFVRFKSPRSPEFVRLEVFQSERTWAKMLKHDDTPEGCRKYCMKKYTRLCRQEKPGGPLIPIPEAGPFEMGNWEEPETRETQLAKVRKRVKDGATMGDLLNDTEVADTVMRTRQGVQAVIDHAVSERGLKVRNNLKVRVYYGAPGAGKSRKAYEEALDFVGGDPRDVFRFPPPVNGKIWWGSYRGQRAVIFDDYANWFPWSYLLNVTDRYPMEVEYKGGHIFLCADLIVFTSNIPVPYWQGSDTKKDEEVSLDHRAAFERRLTRVLGFPAVGEEPQVMKDIE